MATAVLRAAIKETLCTTRKYIVRSNLIKHLIPSSDLLVRYTRWLKYDRDKLWLVYTQIVPVVFEPPCTLHKIIAVLNNRETRKCNQGSETYLCLQRILTLWFKIDVHRKVSWGGQWRSFGVRVPGICLLEILPTMAGRHGTKPCRSMSLCRQRWWWWWWWWSYMNCINHGQARLFIYGWGVYRGWGGVQNEETLVMRLVCITSLPPTPCTIL
jgi:hypothetical protein